LIIGLRFAEFSIQHAPEDRGPCGEYRLYGGYPTLSLSRAGSGGGGAMMFGYEQYIRNVIIV
jgi:hypothetical protein